MTTPGRPSEVMTSRLAPAEAGRHTRTGQPHAQPAFLIEIPAADGTMLLRLREENGHLVIEGDEDRWDEGAKRFLHSMMQWSGLVGIRWRDEVITAVEPG